MKNLLKNALLVCLILCMTVCLGLFAVACGDNNTPVNPPAGNEEDDNSGDNNNEDTTPPEVVISSAYTPVTVNGATKVYFLAGVGTYKCTVNLSQGTSYELSFGSEKHTVSYGSNTFVFSVVATDTFTKQGATEASSGFEVTVTPNESNTDNAVSINLTTVSTVLTKGNNAGLYAEGKVIDTFSITPFDMHGEHKFEFTVAEGDSYNVNVAGEDYTVDEDHNVLELNLTSANRDSNQLGADLYFFTITPAADNTGKTVSVYVYQPVQVIGVGEMVKASPTVTPEVAEKNNNVLTFHFTAPEGLEKIDFTGAMYGGTFNMYEGTDTDAAPVLTVTETGNFSGSFDFNDLAEETDYTYTIVFEDLTSSYLFNGQFWSNHSLFVGRYDDENTEVKDYDKADGKYEYTFTVEEDGWYNIKIQGSTEGVTYTLSCEAFDEDITGETINGTIPNVVNLSEGDVVTVTLVEGTYQKPVFDPVDWWVITGYEEAEAQAYDNVSICILKTTEPIIAVLDQELTVSGNWDGTEFTFKAAEAGTYVITVLSDEAESYISDPDYNNYVGLIYVGKGLDGHWEWVDSAEFDMSANETITFVFIGSGQRAENITIKITKK